MRVKRIEDKFPGLTPDNYRKTSDEGAYNCVAWSVYDTRQWWELVPNVVGYYWPIERDDRLEDWIKVFQLHNYAPTDSIDAEEGFEKIAIYVDADGAPQHAARQLASGKWTSKIGQWEDIEHDTLASLEGDEYGTVAQIMRRQRYHGEAGPSGPHGG
ncbi:MAG: hypothetical protein HYR60_22680 [Acidobacteria bacterium]|nr:hypothetical protein [Acidobacteriota bacterium]MBI3472100.1 hypothetical protein [Candidatus Solibacter usitatus]